MPKRLESAESAYLTSIADTHDYPQKRWQDDPGKTSRDFASDWNITPDRAKRRINDLVDRGELAHSGWRTIRTDSGPRDVRVYSKIKRPSGRITR